MRWTTVLKCPRKTASNTPFWTFAVTCALSPPNYSFARLLLLIRRTMQYSKLCQSNDSTHFHSFLNFCDRSFLPPFWPRKAVRMRDPFLLT